MYDYDEQVDYSDGTLGSPTPPASTPKPQTPSHSRNEERRSHPGQPDESYDTHGALPEFLQSLIDGRSTAPPNTAPDIKNKNIKKTCPGDLPREALTDFVLYQANQKAYEATFLKTFVAHALDASTLDLKAYLGDRPDVVAQVDTYLRSVSDNVCRLADNMIWNAHFKSINFLAKGGKEHFPFVDADRFKKEVFSHFRPNNPASIVANLNQSWHRTRSRLAMVQYSVQDYAIDPKGAKARSPFDELQEASRALSLCNGGNKEVPKGRVFKLSSGPACQPVKNVLPAKSASVVPEPTVPLRPKDSPVGLKKAPGARKGRNVRVTETAPRRSPRGSKTAASTKQASGSGTIVAPSDLDTMVCDIVPTVDQPPPPAQQTWRERLIKDHLVRLARNGDRPPQSSQSLPRDIKSIIATAVASGILKPATPETQKRIDARVAKEKKQRSKYCGRKRKAGQALESAKKKPRTTKGSGRASQSPRKDKRPNPRKPGSTRAKVVRRAKKVEDTKSYPPHPSGSKTLEPHQRLPDNAYFEPADPNEKPAWRCGVQHALGYYYNSGEKRHCIGCFTNVDHSRIKWMDFYLPPKTCFHQPAPGVVWTPSLPTGKPRRCNSWSQMSHNSIAKDVYWGAVNSGVPADEARQKAVDTVLEHLRPKPKVEPEPTPEPSPKPEPVDLGPHPSGSEKMEHGQDIPECHYFEKREENEQPAWRCDVSHALGRYYMAGNKRSCPGCGSNKTGQGRRTEMDFYMPSGTVIRQEVPGPVSWRPRVPYKSKRPRKSKKPRQIASHNQLCALKYWEFIEGGMDHKEAMEKAIAETDAALDAKYASSEPVDGTSEGANDGIEDDNISVDGDVQHCLSENDSDIDMEHNEDGGVVISLFARDSSEGDPHEGAANHDNGARRRPVIDVPDDSSDDDVSSSSSDSE